MVESKTDVKSNALRDVTGFDELKQRFLETLESERERIREQAERESASIITKAEQEAKRIAAEIAMRAEEESKRIITEARKRAEHIAEERIKQAEGESSSITAAVIDLLGQTVKEAERLASDASLLRQKLESELKNAQKRARQEAKAVTAAEQKADNIVVEAKGELPRNIVEPVAAVTERKPDSTKASGVIKADTTKEAEKTVSAEGSVSTSTDGGKEGLEETAAMAKQPNTKKASDDKTFVGTVQFNITAGPNSASLRGLLEHLHRSYGIEVLSMKKLKNGMTRVDILARKPIPMLKILKQMASVSDAFEAENNIQIELAVAPQWVG